MSKFDLISIGDNATDAFIRLSEAELHCDINRPDCKICMKFASKIPYESVTEVPAGGNSSNVAIGTSKLGMTVSYLSMIGDDDHGKKTLAKLNENKVDISQINIQSNTPTNYNYVLWYQDDRTILVKHENYNYQWPRELGEASWLYLSSVSDQDLILHGKISDWLKDNPETKLAFSPGTWQIMLGAEKLKDIYARTEIFFSNRQEAEKILKLPNSTLRNLTEGIRELGPKIVVITDGENGAYCLDQEDNLWFVPVFSKLGSTLERTGAGDALSASFLSARFYNQDIPNALVWGALNAASVVTKIGPHDGLLSRSQLEKILLDSPDFVAKKI